MSIYYVYAYLREDYTPYYIGKGKDKRAWHNNHLMNLPSDRSRIIILHDNLSEIYAFILERYYIKWFGRKDNNTGILRNKTDGGEGSSGLYYTTEIKHRMSESHKGVPLSDNHKRNIGLSLEGKISPKKGKKYDKINHGLAMDWLLTDPNGIQYKITNLAKFSRDNNLNKTHLRRVADGYRQQHKGWKCIRIQPEKLQVTH